MVNTERFFLFRHALVVCLVGVAVYLPSYRVHFFWDDVDFFAALAASLQGKTLAGQIFLFHNGHLSVLPKLGYLANYMFFDRSIVLWHSVSLVFHAVAIASVLYVFRAFFQDRRLALFLTLVFAMSRAYKANLLSPNCTNQLWGVAFCLLSLALLLRFMSRGGWHFYAFSLLSGVFGILSVAVATIVFPAHFLLRWAYPSDGKSKVPVYAASLVLSAATFLLFLTLGTRGATESHFNLVFGLVQTAKGLWDRSLHDTFLSLAMPLFILAVANVLLLRKAVNWRQVAVSLFLAVIPLLMATGFREDFADNNPGRWSRYHHLPLAGVLLFIGLGLQTPNMKRFERFFLQRKAGWYVVMLLLALTGVDAFRHNMKAKTHAELRAHEDLLGEAALEFSRRFETDVVVVPDVLTSLPDFPAKRKLPYIVRYCAPYGAGLKVIPSAKDNRFIEVLRSDPRYLPVVQRLDLPNGQT